MKDVRASPHIFHSSSTSGVRSSSFISGSLGLGEFIEYIVKQLFNICLWIMRSYNILTKPLDFDCFVGFLEAAYVQSISKIE